MISISIPNDVDVSVIIPTYNYGHYLNECLASVYRQKRLNLEIIVVDDGSTDNTQEILKSHRNKIKYIYQENSGPTSARNHGLRVCSGKYIQFLDADDLLGKDCINAKVELLKHFDNKGVAVCRTRVFSDKRWDGIPWIRNGWKLFQEDLQTHLCRLNIAPPHAFLLPREALTEAGLFDEQIKACEDYDYWLKLLGKGYSPIFCKKSVVYYRKHSASRGATKSRNGAFHFDVMVHEKKHLGKYGEGVDRILNTLEGIIAFCDGLVCTAAKIDSSTNNDGKLKLISMLNHYLEVFINSMPNKCSTLPLSAKINLMRFLSRKKMIFQLQDAKLLGLYQLLNKKTIVYEDIRGNIVESFPFLKYDDQSLAYFTIKNALFFNGLTTYI